MWGRLNLSIYIYMHQYPSNWDIRKIGSLQIYINTIQTGMWGRLDLSIYICINTHPTGMCGRLDLSKYTSILFKLGCEEDWISAYTSFSFYWAQIWGRLFQNKRVSPTIWPHSSLYLAAEDLFHIFWLIIFCLFLNLCSLFPK